MCAADRTAQSEDELRAMAARRLREDVRLRLGPDALALAKDGRPIRLSSGEAEEIVNVVLTSLTVDGAKALIDVSRCRCPPSSRTGEGPLRECPVHGEPEEMVAELSGEVERLRTLRHSVQQAYEMLRRELESARAERE